VHGKSFLDAETHAKAVAKEKGMTYLSSHSALSVEAYASISMEILNSID